MSKKYEYIKIITTYKDGIKKTTYTKRENPNGGNQIVYITSNYNSND